MGRHAMAEERWMRGRPRRAAGVVFAPSVARSWLTQQGEARWQLRPIRLPNRRASPAANQLRFFPCINTSTLPRPVTKIPAFLTFSAAFSSIATTGAFQNSWYSPNSQLSRFTVSSVGGASFYVCRGIQPISILSKAGNPRSGMVGMVDNVGNRRALAVAEQMN